MARPPTRRTSSTRQGPERARLAGRPDDPPPATRELLDLLQSPRRHVSLSAFALEDDALVDLSPLLETRRGRDWRRLAVAATTDVGLRAREALTARPVAGCRPGRGDPRPGSRCASRARIWPRRNSTGRLTPSTPVPGRSARSINTVSVRSSSSRGTCSVCPKSTETRKGPDAARARTTPARGFEAFYQAWQDKGHGTVTPIGSTTRAPLFVEVLTPRLERLSPSDAAIERTRFLGSPVAAGLIDVVLRMEAERDVAVVERWLEHRLEGTYALRSAGGGREVSLRGVPTGSICSGRHVSRHRLQVVARLRRSAAGDLRDRRAAAAGRLSGRDWVLGEAAYVAFREDPPVRPLARSPADLDRPCWGRSTAAPAPWCRPGWPPAPKRSGPGSRWS